MKTFGAISGKSFQSPSSKWATLGSFVRLFSSNQTFIYSSMSESDVASECAGAVVAMLVSDTVFAAPGGGYPQCWFGGRGVLLGSADRSEPPVTVSFRLSLRLCLRHLAAEMSGQPRPSSNVTDVSCRNVTGHWRCRRARPSTHRGRRGKRAATACRPFQRRAPSATARRLSATPHLVGNDGHRSSIPVPHRRQGGAATADCGRW